MVGGRTLMKKYCILRSFDLAAQKPSLKECKTHNEPQGNWKTRYFLVYKAREVLHTKLSLIYVSVVEDSQSK